MITPPLNDKSLKQNPIPFALPGPAARQVSLAGDFNNWDPKAMPMRKGADGVWHLKVALKPGRHDTGSLRTECGRTIPPLNKEQPTPWAAKIV